MSMTRKVALGMSTLLAFGMLAGAAFGGTGNLMTVAKFRVHERQARIYMVLGAMNVTNSVDLNCPVPVTVGELEAALMTRALPEDKPWVQAMVELMDERGCGIEGVANVKPRRWEL